MFLCQISNTIANVGGADAMRLGGECEFEFRCRELAVI